ncbi:hypothetical protein RSAG8_12102, partial [Rhizoctonia solani AG-8 WAC10335]
MSWNWGGRMRRTKLNSRPSVCPVQAQSKGLLHAGSEDAKYQHLNQHGLCNLAYDGDRLLTKLSLRPSTRVSNAGCSATDITDEPAPDDQEEQSVEAEIEPRGLDLGEGAGLGDIGGATEGLGSANMSWTDNGRTTEHPYVEAFPCTTAGMPVNSEIFTPPPPAVYLSRCGPFSDPSNHSIPGEARLSTTTDNSQPIQCLPQTHPHTSSSSIRSQ